MPLLARIAGVVARRVQLRSRRRERRRLLNSAAATADPPRRKRRSYACRRREVEAEVSEPTSKHHTGVALISHILNTPHLSYKHNVPQPSQR